MARLAAVCVLAAVACLLNSMAFVPAPESRARAMDTGAVAAAAGVMAVGAPQNAEAFVFKGSFASNLGETDKPWAYLSLDFLDNPTPPHSRTKL